jgi:hypothetical protein
LPDKLIFSEITAWQRTINGIYNRFSRFFFLLRRYRETADAFCPQAAISCRLSL